MKKCVQFLSGSALLIAICFSSAQAETVVCTVIDSLPYTISTQGVYCLTGNLSTGITTGSAIKIEANNVVLDLNGFKIGGLAAGKGTKAYGIFAQKRQNITIKNGTVRGFLVGIMFSDDHPYLTSQGHVVEDIRADQNTKTGLDIRGTGNTVRNNLVIASGGSTINVTGWTSYGIMIIGPGAQVLNNLVTDVRGQSIGDAYGIHLSDSTNSVVAGNRISTIIAGVAMVGGGFGISLLSSSDILVSDNRISGTQYGIWFSSLSTGTYMNNLVRSSGTAYSGGSAAGTTNY